MEVFSKFLFFLGIFLSISQTHEIQLIITNNCNMSIWPATQGSSGHPTPQNGGFHLKIGEEISFNVPTFWSGRIWARQGCSSLNPQSKFLCQTGDCNNNNLQCNGTSGTPPATIVEMTFGTIQSPLHYYDVSLVDGFNLPVTMRPIDGGVGCGIAGCDVNLNVCCPSKFEVLEGGEIVGCKSACLALKKDEYCCTGEFGSPGTCKPTLFSHFFKAICPKAYSFAFDDATSLNRCMASRYVVTFCPPKE